MNDAFKLIRTQASLFKNDQPPLGLDEYQRFTATTDKNPRPGIEGLGFVLLGLYGETGSLLAELKKKQRDSDSYVAYAESVTEELGDVLWYFANAAARAGLPLSSLAERTTATLSDWDYHGQIHALTFRELQRESAEFKGPLSDHRVQDSLLLLAGKVGNFVNDFRSGLFDANRDALSAHMVEIFRALIIAADDADVGLEQAALDNIKKAYGRWPLTREWESFYDDEFSTDEQLPRHIEMVIKEVNVGGRLFVVQQCNDIKIGDQITDNKVEQDDYRFHDVFHLAYTAVLGWSPVIRSLFKVKRKSKPDVDENQDGARAILIEEGISTWVFNHATRNYLFRNIDSIDYSLLKAIREFVKGYEVESRPLWQWEIAILDGYRVFRDLTQHRQGLITADMKAHTIEFREIG